jgi:ATP-dependent Clp protease protease subunit
MGKSKYFQFEVKEDKADLFIYGDIVSYKWLDEDVTANDIKEQIRNLNVSELNVHINSYGGDVFEGVAIYNLLKQHKAKVNVYIDGCACSIASVIAMAGDKIYMPKNTLMMIHNCWTVAMGNSKDLRKQADDLDIIMNSSIESYMARVNITEKELRKLLDDETWLTAEECVEKGFADELLPLAEDSINQSANLAIMNLVNKLKERTEPIQQEDKPIDEPIVDEPVIEEPIIDEPVIDEPKEEPIEDEKTPKNESPRKAFLSFIKKEGDKK